MQENGSRRQLLISAGLVILVIVLLFALVDVGAVIEMLLLADWRMLLLATVFLVIGYGLTTLRTRYMLGNKPGYLDTLKVDSSGMMLGILIQFTSSAYRVVTLDRTTPAKASEATSVIVAEVVLSLLMRVIVLALGITLLAGAVQGQEQSLLIGVVVVVVLLIVLYVAATRGEQLQPKLARGLQRLPLIDEPRGERVSLTLFGVVSRVGSPRRFGVALLLTMAYWLCAFAFFFFVLQAFELEESISYPLVALVTVFLVPPASPLMVGVFHGVLIAPLVALNLMDTEVATAYAVLLHAIEMVVLIALGAWGLSRMNISLGEVLAEVRGRVGKKGSVEQEAAASSEAAGPPTAPAEDESGS